MSEPHHHETAHSEAYTLHAHLSPEPSPAQRAAKQHTLHKMLVEKHPELAHLAPDNVQYKDFTFNPDTLTIHGGGVLCTLANLNLDYLTYPDQKTGADTGMLLLSFYVTTNGWYCTSNIPTELTTFGQGGGTLFNSNVGPLGAECGDVNSYEYISAAFNPALFSLIVGAHFTIFGSSWKKC